MAFADTPPPGTVKAKTWSGDGATSITATGTALDVNVTNATGLTTVNQGLGGVSAWKVDGSSFTQPVSGTFFQATQPVSGSLGRTWTLLNTTDSVNVGNFPAAFGRTWNLTSGSDSVAAVQSGTWTTGRTWNLSSGSDSVTVVGSISATNSANGPSGSPPPVDTTQTGGYDGTNLRAFKVSSTGVLSVDGSATTQPVSAASLPLPAGASTSANQTTANASLASIDSKLTAPITISAASLPLPAGASTSANQVTANGSLSSIDSKTLTAGQKTMANSYPVVVASDQSAIPISGTVTATNSANGNTGAAVPAQATQVGGSDGTNLRALKVDATGVLSTSAAQSGTWTTGRTWSLLNSTDSVNSVQSGSWTTGRTWTLLNTTDSVNVGNFPATQAVTQSTSPWVVSGTVAATQSGTWNVGLNTGTNTIGSVKITDGTNTASVSAASALKVDGSAVTQPISAASLPLPTGAATSALQTTGNSSLSSIDTKTLTAGQKTMANSYPVVVASDQSTLPTQNQVLAGTGTGTALNQTPIPDTDASRYQCLKFQVTGTFTATLTMEGSSDDVNWLSIYFKDVNATNTAQNQTVTNTGGTSVFQMPINTRRVRLRVSAFTSGTATVTYDFSTLPCSQDMGIRTVTINGSVATTLSSGTLTSQAVTTDIASAARTTTFTSGNINPQQGAMSESFGLNVTAVSGTNPTMDCVINESNDTAANYQTVYAFQRITATGQYWTPMRRISGNRLQYVCTIAGTTPSFTFTLFRIDSQGSAPFLKRYFDRAIVPNTGSSTTATYDVEGCDKVSYGVAMSTITTTAATYDIQLSQDGTVFDSQGSTITPAANSAKSIQALNVVSKFARLIVTSAGSGATLNYAWLQCVGR